VSSGTKPLNLCNAVNDALHVAMEADDTACVFGEVSYSSFTDAHKLRLPQKLAELCPGTILKRPF
jgi:hypothetical protein